MRITGGKAKGIPLSSGKSKAVRPATDRSRESVFSSLAPFIEGSRVLDLFAGTGSYGLEAISRGAKEVIFVEKDYQSIASLKSNLAAVLKSMGPDGAKTSVLKRDVLKFQSTLKFELIFVDPPYPLLRERTQHILQLCHALLAPEDNSRLVLEAPGDLDIQNAHLEITRRLGKGAKDPTICILKLNH